MKIAIGFLIAVLLLAVCVIMFKNTKPDMNKAELASLIKSFADGSCGRWDWDDFTSVRQDDPDVEKARQHILSIPEKYPSSDSKHWCNEDGMRVLLEIAASLSH